MIAQPFVDVRNLGVTLRSRDGDLRILQDVSFALEEGEVLCLLGESGSGKSMTMRSLMRLVPANAALTGAIHIGGTDMLSLSPGALRKARGSLMAMIFQEPATAFDPAFTIGHQISEAIRVHDAVSKDSARKRALELLERVQVPSAARRLDAYPHELSGGLRQRAMIALALSCRPKLLLADEPTTALDATVQIQVLLLLRELQKELGMTTILVTHDIGVACEVADRIAVMYAGRIVETGTVEDILERPAHPYTAGLLASMVTAQSRGTRLQQIEGAPPDLTDLPEGCSFAPRCARVHAVCEERVPDFRSAAPDHTARCVLVAPPAAMDIRTLETCHHG